MHVMHRADEVIDARVLGQLVDERCVGRPDPFPLEPDEEGDLGGVFGAQPGGFG